MTFTNLIFIYGFFPIVFLLYLPFAKTRFNNLFLLIVSLLFYAWGSLQSLFILVFILLWNYLCALELDSQTDPGKRKKQLIFAVAVNLFVLVMYKYVNPMLLNINRLFSTSIQPIGWVIPMGLSFYIFSCLSCLFDVYRQKETPLKSLIDFGVFAAFFGWVNMGPIAHFGQVKPQLAFHPVTRQKMALGALFFVQGLVMKVVLADNFALVFSDLSGNTSWLGNLLLGFSYFFQLFFDFAGYSRMARGIASLFGFDIPKNFDLPYTATSVAEFWRRWHISLTKWFREYVYIPLGGNRVLTSRWILNTLAVWILTGIWHGGAFHFVLWGLYQAGWLLLERLVLKNVLSKTPSAIKHTYVVLSQLIGWTLFFPSSTLECLQIIGRYFFIGISALANSEALFVLKGSLLLFTAGIICSTSLPQRIGAGIARSLQQRYPIVQTGIYLLALGICTILLIGSTNQTFLYAAF